MHIIEEFFGGMRQVACVALSVGEIERGADRQAGRRAVERSSKPEGRVRRILPEYTQAAATSSVDKSVLSDVFCISLFYMHVQPFSITG